MIYTAYTLPVVDPMMVRQFHPLDGWMTRRDKVVIFGDFKMEVADIGLADVRLPFDEDVVDVSGFTLEFTTELMMRRKPELEIPFMVFTSRRWRNHRWEKKDGDRFDMEWPTDADPLLFIGNPFIISTGPDGVTVHRERSYQMRTGCKMLAKQHS